MFLIIYVKIRYGRFFLFVDKLYPCPFSKWHWNPAVHGNPWIFSAFHGFVAGCTEENTLVCICPGMTKTKEIPYRCMHRWLLLIIPINFKKHLAKCQGIKIPVVIRTPFAKGSHPYMADYPGAFYICNNPCFSRSNAY